MKRYIHGYNPDKFRNYGKILLIIRQGILITIIIIIILDVLTSFSLFDHNLSVCRLSFISRFAAHRKV